VRRLAALLVALALPSAAIAAERQIALPDPHGRLTPAPPLLGTVAPGELRLVRTGETREVVRIGIDGRGLPVAVEVSQRIELLSAGDYSFVVPAPVRDVRAPPGAQAQPGLLEGAIVWQGFSPGRRTLAAVAELEPGAAAPVLPLALTLRTLVARRPLEAGERRSGEFDLALEVRNRTAVTVDSFAGRGDPAELARTLDGVRSRLTAGLTPGRGLVHANVAPARVRVDAGFRVTGELRLPASLTGARVRGGRLHGSLVRFAATLGGGRPRVLRVRVTGRVTAAAAPRIALEATPVGDVPGLRPPHGRTWRQALAAGLVVPDGERLLGTAVEAMLRLARVNQYRTFLQTPGLPEQAQATYTWATAAPAAAAVSPPGGKDENEALTTAVAVAAAVLGLGVAVTVWAYL
jgi:hypothetical protein